MLAKCVPFLSSLHTHLPAKLSVSLVRSTVPAALLRRTNANSVEIQRAPLHVSCQAKLKRKKMCISRHLHSRKLPTENTIVFPSPALVRYVNS